MSRLPVDYDHLQYDRIEFSTRDWDQTPRVSTTREIDRLMPDISRLAANEITACADMNDLRCFMFNLMAEREFENKDFENLCQFLADFTEFRVEEQKLNDAARGLEDSIVHGVRFYCAGLMDRFPELRDIVDSDRNPQTARSWDVNLGQYREIIDIIDEMHKQDQSDLRNRGTSRAYDRGQDDDRRYARDSRDRRDERGGRGGRDDRGSRSGRDRDRQSHVDSRGNYNVRASTDGGTSRDRDRGRDDRDDRSYGRDRRDTREVRDQRSDNPAFDPSDFVTAPTTTSRTEEATYAHRDSVEEIVSQHRLTPVVEPEQPVDDGTMFYGEFGPIKLLVPKGTTDMDIIAHASIYGKTAVSGQDMAEEVRRVLTASQAVKETNVTSENLDQEDIIVETGVEMFATVSAMCDGISNSSTAAMVANAGENKDGRRQIFHKSAVVSNAFIGHPHLTDFHNRLSEQTSFTELLHFMRRATAAVDTNASQDAAYASDIRAAVDFYDAYFANEISMYCQDVLRMRVGDPNKPLLTSAISGFDAVVNYLTESGQDNMRSALAAMLSNLMINITHNWEVASGVAAGVAGDVESLKTTDEVVLGSVHLPVGYIVSHLPFTMKELGYEINEPVVIPDDSITNFLKAALDISKTDLIDEDINPAPIRIMMTRDRKVFRVTRYPGNGRAMVLVPVHVN